LIRGDKLRRSQGCFIDWNSASFRLGSNHSLADVCVLMKAFCRVTDLDVALSRPDFFYRHNCTLYGLALV